MMWVLLRAAGIGAFVALFLSVAWGLLGSASLTPRWISKPSANLFHAAVASTGLVLLVVHLGLLLADRVVRFDPLDLLVPMRSTYRPVAVAAGIFAMYATAAIIMTSWLRRRVGAARWRRVHLLAVPAFSLALLHGLLAGSDGGRPWMLTLYASTGAITLFLVLVRGLTARERPARRAATRAAIEEREPASAA
jgi:methionine sulfoxide reductase heme-binding subunit